MKKIILLLTLMFSLLSCEKEKDILTSDDFVGTWNNEVYQLKIIEGPMLVEVKVLSTNDCLHIESYNFNNLNFSFNTNDDGKTRDADFTLISKNEMKGTISLMGLTPVNFTFTKVN